MKDGVSRRPWWHRWFVQPVLKQLTLGVEPDRLAWTMALAAVLGVFPIMGTTSLVCLLVGWALRLNQPVLHAINTLLYPLHLALILVFIRLGERIAGAPLIAFSVPQLLERFKADPAQFARDFGWAAWHGVSAWLIVAPIVVVVLKLALTPVLQRVAEKIHPRADIPA